MRMLTRQVVPWASCPQCHQ